MKLSLRFLQDCQNVNSFEAVNVYQFVKGSTDTLYFQLLNDSLDSALQGFVPAGRRYVAATGAVLQVQFTNVDDNKKILKFATQPFPGDLSIWSVPILMTDPMEGSVTIYLTLTEPGGKVYQGTVMAGLGVCC